MILDLEVLAYQDAKYGLSSTDFGVCPGVMPPFLWLAADWLSEAVLTARSLATVYEVVKFVNRDCNFVE